MIRKKLRSKLILLSIVLVGIGTWALSLRSWTTNSSSILLQTKTASSFSLSWITHNITGTLLISPGSYNQRKNLVNESTGFLYGRLYTFTHKDLKKLRTQIADRWVDTKLILEDRKYKQLGSDFKTLQQLFDQHKISIKSDTHLGTNYVHTKSFVSSGFAIIQTANLTHSSFDKNREYLFITRHSDIIANLKVLFEKDRLGEPISPQDIHPNILVCPINCREVIQTLLQSAQDSLIIQTQYIQDPTIQDLVIHSKAREKRIIVADVDTSNLFIKRISPRFAKKLKKPYIHAKMILIDNRYLLIGSMNLSSNSLDNNRENGIILTDPSIIAQFKQQFDQDRAKANKK